MSGWLAALLICLVLVGIRWAAAWLTGSGFSAPPQVTAARYVDPSVAAEGDRLKEAPKLVASAKSTNHPGIIWRFACQVPAQSPQYSAALVQMKRAEGIWDRTIMRPRRKALAAALQDQYYRRGMEIECSAREGAQPTLALYWVLFGNTTAWQADQLLSAETQRGIAEAGFREILWSSGYAGGGSSSVSFKSGTVRELEFAWINDLCEAVRRGEKGPDAINSTVRNPS